MCSLLKVKSITFELTSRMTWKSLVETSKEMQGFLTPSSFSLFVVQLKSGRNRPKTYTLILLNERKEFNLLGFNLKLTPYSKCKGSIDINLI